MLTSRFSPHQWTYRAITTGLLLVASHLASVASAQDEAPWLRERKIQGKRHLEPIEATKGTAAYTYALAVGRMEQVDPGTDNGIGYCTAIHVGADLFLTNEHCLRPCDRMNIRLGYERDAPVASQQVYRCSQVVARSTRLDYALIVAPAATDTGPVRLFPVMALSRSPVQEGLQVILAGQATGGFKEIDRSSSCVVSSATLSSDTGRDTIKHMCDTLEGSSGSPLIDPRTGYAVALHWAGISDAYNMAIPMALIVADLEERLSPALLGQLSTAP